MEVDHSLPRSDELLEPASAYLLDLSTIIWWAGLERPGDVYAGARFLVPDALTTLLLEYREPPQWFASLRFRYTTAPFFAKRANADFNRLWPFLQQLLDRGVIRAITEMDDESADEDALRHALGATPESNRPQRGDTIADVFIERYLVTMLQFSYRTRTPILMKARTLPQRLRERVTVLELANHVDDLIERKQALTVRVFGGGRLGRRKKVFVGIVVSLAGMGNPFASTVGVLLAFMDP